MARTLPTLHETDLEAALLRKSVGSLTAGRATCGDCGRTPLVGERMYTFGSETTVCALCAPGHAGAPDGVEMIRHFERGLTVRRITPAAA